VNGKNVAWIPRHIKMKPYICVNMMDGWCNQFTLKAQSEFALKYLEFAGCFIYNKFTGLHWP
jgi:hypothetical protein